MRRRGLVISLAASGVALAAAVGITLGGGASPAGGQSGLGFRFGGDAYRYVLYAPPGRRLGPGRPLVVVLHGCTMTAAQEAAATGYDQIAAARGFVVLYPDVDAVDRENGRCWRGIWDPLAEGRGRGDAGAIAAMTKAVIARWRIDPSRVYALGISAGGFETAILGAVYPDLFTAIGIHSGAGYLAGEQGCSGSGSGGDSDGSARAALAAMGSRARVMPVIVFHGDRDGRIPYGCGQQALAQWLATDDLVLQREHRAPLPSAPTESSRPSVAGAHAYTVFSYAETSGCPVAQFWSIHGMGHYWSGGSAAPASARYSDPRGPSASAASWAFFSHWQRSGRAAGCAQRSGRRSDGWRIRGQRPVRVPGRRRRVSSAAL
jgi:poly(hydroxyalkanoate) depolymerase family esterase